MKDDPIDLRFPGWVRNFSLILLSSLLLVLSFPNFGLGFLAWLALLPLLLALSHKSPSHGFLLSLTCGILFFAGFFYWILEVSGYTLLHHALLAVYLGPYWGCFGLAFTFISRYWNISAALSVAPFIWVSLEYIRSNFSFLALPLALLAHSQYQYPSVIQIASLAGTYSISFLIVMVNSALASLFFEWQRSLLSRPSEIPSTLPLPALGGLKRSRGGVILVMTTASFIIFALIYGHIIISKPITGKVIRVSLIQGNIEQTKKWNSKYAREIMEIYTDLTLQASKDRPDMIIWPETATPGSISLNPSLRTEIRDIVIKLGTPLLVGSAQHQKFDAKESVEFKYLNSAYCIQPEQVEVMNQRYDKVRLFPFGEYLPYQRVIPWSLLNIRESVNYAAGEEFTIFKLHDFRFGVTICWENVFPDLFRQFVRKGAQFIVNMTNEARFGKTAAPYQLAYISVFRAVENRIFVIRCANTGVSCIIDPYGRILDSVKDEKGQELFVRGRMNGCVIPLESNTIYTQYGDYLAWISMVVSLGVITNAGRRKRQTLT